MNGRGLPSQGRFSLLLFDALVESISASVPASWRVFPIQTLRFFCASLHSKTWNASTGNRVPARLGSSRTLASMFTTATFQWILGRWTIGVAGRSQRLLRRWPMLAGAFRAMASPMFRVDSIGVSMNYEGLLGLGFESVPTAVGPSCTFPLHPRRNRLSPPKNSVV